MSEKFLRKPQEVQLNWGGSKDCLIPFVSQFPNGHRLSDMIYDLGHFGRGYDNFGKEPPIIFRFGKARFLDQPSYMGQRLEAHAKLTYFLTTVERAITDYLNTDSPWRNQIAILHTIIETLDPKQLAILTFDPERNKFRELISIS